MILQTTNNCCAGYSTGGGMSYGKSIVSAGALVVCLGSAAACCAAAADVPPPLKPETTDVATLSPGVQHRFIAIPYEGNMQVFSGDRGTEEGELPAGTGSNVIFSHDSALIYLTETLWPHNNRGKRIDLLTVYDTKTLTAIKEVTLPGRTLVAWKIKNLELNASGTRAYVYNMHPSSSVIWVDLNKSEVAGTVEMPGCGLAFAWGDNGFASLCADGALATVVVPDKGAATVTHSKPFFDAEHDPIFDTSLSDSKTGQAVFMSYTGLVYQVKLGPEPTIAAPWSINDAAGQRRAGTGSDELAWRPGGLQPLAWHKASNRLFVLMHAGNYWTHNAVASEVWVLSLTDHKLLARYPVHAKSDSTVPDGTMRGIAVSQDDKPQIYLLTQDGGDTVVDANTGELLHIIGAGAGAAAVVPGV
jgi:methylamine dehydrogenase heavy chain